MTFIPHRFCFEGQPLEDPPEPIPFRRWGAVPAHVFDRLAPADARMTMAARFWCARLKAGYDKAGRLCILNRENGAVVPHPIGILPELLWLARQAEAQVKPSLQRAAYPQANHGGY